MPLVTINTAPALDAFVPLEEHEAQTPSSFYGSKPILHHHSTGGRAVARKEALGSLPIFKPDSSEVQNVDIFVSSESLILWNVSSAIGVVIPYATISLHAIQRLPDPSTAEEVQGLYMQLDLPESNAENDDDDEMSDPFELTLLPTSQDSIPALFAAVSNCSALHPDPVDEAMESDDRVVFEGDYESVTATDGMPPPFPGSGGWITASNVHEYFDADGNWIKDDASRVRERSEDAEGHVDKRSKVEN